MRVHHEESRLAEFAVYVYVAEGVVADFVFVLVRKRYSSRLIHRGVVAGVIIAVYTKLYVEGGNVEQQVEIRIYR